MEYDFRKIEPKAKEKWEREKVYKVQNPVSPTTQPKCYILDMFPYPSGAGLHVGHPLGYIASDIYARYKKLCGYNVLHPMGFDAFGLPAEQYAIETGQHPAVTTEKNIARYREQLDNIGFCYDWDRQVRTSDPDYYKWTQWIFLQLFHSWYDKEQQKARPIAELVEKFKKSGHDGSGGIPSFSADAWNNKNEQQRRAILMQFRLAYQGHADVWWCEALGTVLANDEVVNGVSERGGHPVERKQMRQWFLRITAYADRLLHSLENLEWSEAMKEMQRNWIGRSSGATIHFKVKSATDTTVTVFTTRPDTIFGVDFMVLAPEHELVEKIMTGEQAQPLAEYIKYVKSRSERERMSEVKQVTGCFTGAFAIHPFTGAEIPIWISEYVLAGYGTGAIMAVPAGDDRDHAFAKHFGIPITNVFGDRYNGEKAYSDKAGTIENSSFLSGLEVPAAVEAAITAVVEKGIGERKVNYRLRDAGFSRQRYWGEPFPIVYIDDVPYATDEAPLKGTEIDHLPVALPYVEHYKPGPEGQGPLANVKEWVSPTPPVSVYNWHMEKETPQKQINADNSTTSFVNGGGKDEFTDSNSFGNSGNTTPLPEAGGKDEFTDSDSFGNSDNTTPLPEAGGKDEFTDSDSFGNSDNTTPLPEGRGDRGEVLKNPSPNQVSDHRGEVLKNKAAAPPQEIKYSGTMPKYQVKSVHHFEMARLNRMNATETEAMLWQQVRGGNLGLKFRRQHPIDVYIVDFVCLSKALIVEIDGGYHKDKEQQFYDNERTKLLETIGFKVIRFTNEEILRELEQVIAKIKEAAANLPDLISAFETSPPAPLPSGRGEEESPKKEINPDSDTTPLPEVGGKDEFSDSNSFDNSGNITPLPEGRGDRGEVLNNPSPTQGSNDEGEVNPGYFYRETNTMPGYAGSSWYFLRYMDPHNKLEFASRHATDYWQQVDVYVGGTEHAVGHLLYSRMWTKVLYDLGYIGFDEPFKRLLNQGMIQGSSRFASKLSYARYGSQDENEEYLPSPTITVYVSQEIIDDLGSNKSVAEFLSNVHGLHDLEPASFRYDKNKRVHVNVKHVDGFVLNIKAFREDHRIGAEKAIIIGLDNNGNLISDDTGRFLCSSEVEKMSKSKHNVENPDDIVAQYGADTFRMYEMFLGPVEISKPWDTKGIEGVHRFLKKLWRLYADEQKGWQVTDDTPTADELRVLHKTIRKTREDIERFALNTAVSQFMICVNDLTALTCHKRAILEPLAILICPFAPHLAEELWYQMGNTGSVIHATFPDYDDKLIAEQNVKYPIAVNGKTRVELEFPVDADQRSIEQEVLANPAVIKWMEGKTVKKFIFVKGKMVNVVI